MLRTVIVDDEQLALERLKLLLQDSQDIEIVQECRDGEEALAYLQANAVDLLFLDIQMPAMSGLQVVDQLGLMGMPATVFVTAYQEYAIRAFEVEAIDYLTKPIEPLRLKMAVDRVRERVKAKQALLTQAQFTALLGSMQTVAASPSSGSSYTKRLLVRDGIRDVLVAVEEIEWIEAADYYSSLHVGNRTLLVRESLTELSGRLDPAMFLRVHRSAVVNLNCVREIFREGPDEGTVVLTNGTKIKLSRSGRRRLSEF
jgi:two-component system, LytTR family, response regulator